MEPWFDNKKDKYRNRILKEEKMDKLEQLKEVMKNPPPERLAEIEYKSHFYQIFGISAVCIILFMKGLWYIIFALIFGVGVSYAQGMTAYQRYNAIMRLKNPERLEDYDKDISFTRRRNKIVNSVIPKSNYLSVIVSVILTMMIIDPTLTRWILMVVYPLTIFIIYIFFNFYILYWITYPIYKRRIKI